MEKSKWIWMPHAAHFICGHECQFHLATKVGKYIISTVGELWRERSSREVHARVFNPKWFTDNKHLKGDEFDNAYMKEFGFDDIGYERKYETMVFLSKKTNIDGCKACPYIIASGQNLDFDSYNKANEAFDGHMKMCKKWSKKKPPSNQ